MKHILKTLIIALVPFVFFSCEGTSGVSGKMTKEKISDTFGNSYKTVTIGSQVWIAENIRTPLDSTSKAYAPNNDTTLIPTYGYLYTWEDAQKVCPEGWRLPTKDEAKTLRDSLMGDASAVKLAGKKEAWKDAPLFEEKEFSSVFGQSLFNAIPAGYYYNNNYYAYQYNTSFWTSSLDDSKKAEKQKYEDKKAYSFSVCNDNKDAVVAAIDRNFALSVRCIRK